MVIKADKEAQKVLAELADIVLKAMGLQAHRKIGELLNSIQTTNEVDSPHAEKKD